MTFARTEPAPRADLLRHRQIIANFGNEDEGSDNSSAEQDYTDKEDSELVAKAKKEAQSDGEYTFTERDGEFQIDSFFS